MIDGEAYADTKAEHHSSEGNRGPDTQSFGELNLITLDGDVHGRFPDPVAVTRILEG